MSIFGFGKKKKGTVDFRNIAGAKIPVASRDYNYSEGSVDLRENKMPSNNKVGDIKLSNSFKTHSNVSSNNSNVLEFLDSSATTGQSDSAISSNVVTQISQISEIKTSMRKLSSQIENSSNEVYRLLQRIELLEKKIQRLESKTE